jgi:predicted RNA-binding protein Jag
MNANIKEHMQEMTARMETNQAKLEAHRKANQEHMQDMLARMDAAEKTSNRMESEMSQAETSESRNSDTLIGYSGQAALRREQCNAFDQCVARQHLCKHEPTR